MPAPPMEGEGADSPRSQWDPIMVSYDPDVLQHFAERLYKKADNIVVSCTLLGAIAGGCAGFALGFNFPLALAGMVFGGLIGAAVGKSRSFHLRLQAQLTLCQKSIEQNTRQSASADNARFASDMAKAAATPTASPLPAQANVTTGFRSAAALAAVSVLLVLVIAGVWFAPRNKALASLITPAPSSPASPAATPAIPVHATIEIEAGKGRTYALTPPDGKMPGWLTGRWTSKGKSAGIAGAHDDSLIAFKIVGPDNQAIDEKADHPNTGNFKLRFDGPGAYTLIFDNGGILRSSARVVELDGSYQPD